MGSEEEHMEHHRQVCEDLEELHHFWVNVRKEIWTNRILTCVKDIDIMKTEMRRRLKAKAAETKAKAAAEAHRLKKAEATKQAEAKRLADEEAANRK